MGRTGQGSCGASYFVVQVCYAMALRIDTKIYKLQIKMGRTGQGSCGASYFVVQVCYAMAMRIDTKIYNYK